MLDTVLGLHAVRLSHAAVGVNSAALSPVELPVGARPAAAELRRLAATASRRNGSRYRRALAASTAHLDLQDPNQLDLLRRYGPFSTDLRIWVEDDPLPVVQATENLEGRPRVTYRLTTDEQDRLEANLEEAGLADVRRAAPRPRRSLELGQDRTNRAMAADASATFASASGPPVATASRTQWPR